MRSRDLRYSSIVYVKWTIFDVLSNLESCSCRSYHVTQSCRPVFSKKSSPLPTALTWYTGSCSVLASSSLCIVLLLLISLPSTCHSLVANSSCNANQTSSYAMTPGLGLENHWVSGGTSQTLVRTYLLHRLIAIPACTNI